MPTATGIRFSGVALGALADNCPAAILAAPAGTLINVYDASNRLLSGLKGANGTSEGLGSELVTGWTNNVTYPFETWTPGTGNVITQAINTTGDGLCYKNTITPNYSLVKCVNILTVGSGDNPYVELCNGPSREGGGQLVFINNNTSYQNSRTRTWAIIGCASATDFGMSAYSLKLVISPSPSGCIILNAGGEQSWISIDPNFTWNAASYAYNLIPFFRRGMGLRTGSRF